jgi:Integrase core domain
VDPVGGRRRRIWAFVMVLAVSRMMFVRPVLTMDQRAWTECHVEAFAFFGGVPKRLVPDNLCTGVARPDLYDPKINRSYADQAPFTAHWSILPRPVNQKTSRGWNGRCPMCGTRSGVAGNGCRWPRCSRRRSAGVARWQSHNDWTTTTGSPHVDK